MLKKLSLVLVLLATSGVLSKGWAGSISADMRLDYDSNNYNDEATKTGSLYNNNTFRVQTGRVDFKGALNEDLNYRLRLRFDKDKSQNVNKRDNVDSSVDLAYLSHKWTDNISVSIGKIASQVGGFEGNTPGPDIYLASPSYAGTSYLGGSRVSGTTNTSTLGLKNVLYYTGAEMALQKGWHKLTLQVANQEGAVGLGYGKAGAAGTAGYDDNSGFNTSNDGPFAQNKLMTGVIYRLNIADWNMNWLASYHAERFSSKDNKIGLMAVGLEHTIGDFKYQLDYINNKYQKDFGNEVITSTPAQSLTGFALNTAYRWDNFNFLAKGAFFTEKMDTGSASGISADVTNTYTDWGLTAEYIPKKEQNMRYHVAYLQRTMKPDSGLFNSDSARSLSEIIVGTRINADFLK